MKFLYSCLLIMNVFIWAKELIELDMEKRQKYTGFVYHIYKFFQSKEIEVIKNSKAQLYAVRFTIGSNREDFNVIIDTGSLLLWIPSNDCYRCASQIKKYNERSSTSYRNLSEPKTIQYADGSFSKGYLSEEIVNVGSVYTNLTFLLTYEMSQEIEGSSGILGLGLDYQSEESSSIISMLYQNNQISKKLFSQKFEGEKGKLFIGDLAPEISNNLADYSTCKVPKDVHFYNMWACRLEGFFVGFHYSYDKIFKIHNRNVLYDSGTNFIVFDQKTEDLFTKYFFRDYLEKGYCSRRESYYFCNTFLLELFFPPLYFIVNGLAYRIDGKDLFLDISYGYVQLRVSFVNDQEDLWILGQPFLENYHVVYNMDEEQIGFYGGKKYNAKEYVDNEAEPKEENVPIHIYILLLFVVIIIIAIAIYKCKLMRRRHRAVNSNQRQNINEPILN
jgi:hypothetical protein